MKALLERYKKWRKRRNEETPDYLDDWLRSKNEDKRRWYHI